MNLHSQNLLDKMQCFWFSDVTLPFKRYVLFLALYLRANWRKCFVYSFGYRQIWCFITNFYTATKSVFLSLNLMKILLKTLIATALRRYLIDILKIIT